MEKFSKAVSKTIQINKVAIKVLEKIKLKHQFPLIKNECQVLQKLDHPNIINYLDVFEDLENIFIVTELVKGKDLFQIY